MLSKDRINSLFDPDKLIWLVLLVLFSQRIFLLIYLGDYEPSYDALGYINAGKWFVQSGILSIYDHYPSAMVMPGMAVFIGFLSLFFDTYLAIAIRVVWCILGSFTAYWLYKAAKLIMPKWFALLCACALLTPDYAYIDNCILTESPYYFFFMMNIYYMFAMGKSDKRRFFIGYTLSFLLSLMFRANILSCAVFAAIFLWYSVRRRKGSMKLLLRRGLVFVGALGLFVVPWTIRNYICFDAFVPITYGAGNPLLLGTYQGSVSPPQDADLDYETNVEQVMLEKYAKYYDSEGNIKNPSHKQYLSLQRDSIKAKYRIREWLRRDFKGFLYVYLYNKPRALLTWVWYMGPSKAVAATLHLFRIVNLGLCFIAVVLAFWKKKGRFLVSFLMVQYAIGIYSICIAYAIDRYATMYMPLRYLMAAFGLYLLYDLLSSFLKTRKAAL